MSTMIKITNTDTFKGPHQSMEPVWAGASLQHADSAMIMIHGRGASAQSILTLADELDIPENMALVAPQASGHTWYPYSFLAPTDQNQPGLNSGLQQIFNLITELNEAGVPKEKIWLLGFSQGACLISEFVARHPDRYAGLFALSGGVIGDSVDVSAYSGDLKGTPVFLGCSDSDPHIPESRLHESKQVFDSLNANVDLRIYPGMPHTINMDEINAINEQLKS